MIRATTPKHMFVFGFDPSEFTEILITYKQGNNIVLEKTKEDLTFETNTDDSTGTTEYIAWHRLSQEETKLFSAAAKTCQVQVRALTAGGEALASEKKVLNIQDVLNDEVLS